MNIKLVSSQRFLLKDKIHKLSHLTELFSLRVLHAALCARTKGTAGKFTYFLK